MTFAMVAVRPAAYGPKLDPGRDLAIIACERNSTSGRTVGLRWGARRELGFPVSGFAVTRQLVGAAAGTQPTLLGTYFLPVTTSWAAFEADVLARQPVFGPWFPVIVQAELAFLLPLVRFTDPRVLAADRLAQVPAVADFFGQVHRSDAELAWHIWRHNPAPPLAALLADATSAPRVLQFYLQHTVDFLLVLALRFEYAVLLGLGTDDRPTDGTVVYELFAAWGATAGSSLSDPVQPGRRCAPAAPVWVRAERAPGTVPHPAFRAWPNWTPPPALAAQDASGAPLPASASVPKVPAAFSALTWADKAPEFRLLGYGPVLYEIARFDHGPATAATMNAPALPANVAFVPLGDGELVAQTNHAPHLLDRPGMPWPPLEGHYHYEVRGVDLLGTMSTLAARTSIRHHDDLAPPAPRARAGTGAILAIPPGVTQAHVPLDIDWEAMEDFNGPDTAEFRVSAFWIPTVAVPVHITAVTDIDILHCDLTVAALPAPANGLAGTRLSVPGSEYPIVSHGAGAPTTMRVRKIGSRMPIVGTDGIVFTAGTPSPRTRAGRCVRRPATPATVAAAPSLAPLEVTLTAATAMALPADTRSRLYLHVLRATLDATYDSITHRWRLDEPPAETPARAAWDRWIALANRAAVLVGSPVIVYPPHSLTVDISLPLNYSAGLLTLLVTAADGATYVASPVLPVVDNSLADARGNESGAFEVFISVRSTQPPASPGIAPWDPSVRLWARSATKYVEFAERDLTWTAVPGAVRYEVWRALEGGIQGATSATSDATLRTLAAQQANAFELRSDQVFAPSFTDRIPGRAPTRALYRLRTIALNGVPSAPSDIIGPVHIPDVRQPPAPNLVRAVATTPEESDRTIAVEWTQAADTGDVRFDVYFRLAGSSTVPFLLAGVVPRGTAAGPGGAFRFLHLERPPGKAFEYYVVPVREALDPIDPSAAVRRDIAGAASATRVGTAISSAPLAAPVSLAAAYDPATARVTLSWVGRDFYDRIEVRRKAPNRYGFVVTGTVPGDAVVFAEPTPGPGTWVYQVRAFGASRQTQSDVDAQVTIHEST